MGYSINHCYDARSNMSKPSPLVTIRNHSLNSVDIRAEVPQLHLLTLTGLNSQRIRVHPFIRRDVGRFVGVYKDVEHGWVVDDG